MRLIENKIPPVAVWLFFAGLMYLLARIDTELLVPDIARYSIASLWLIVGAYFGFAGILTFRRAQTTVNPVNINSASSLVRTGIFSRTRNPMYLGLAAILVGWAVLLLSPLALLGVLGFVLFINQFQIKPEERAMLRLFGQEYEQYQSAVRRWL